MRLVLGLLLLILTATSAAAAEVRTWTSSGGGFTVEASLLDLVTLDNGDVVVLLLRPDGAKVRVPLVKLSAADQKHLDDLIDSGWQPPVNEPDPADEPEEPETTDEPKKPDPPQPQEVTDETSPTQPTQETPAETNEPERTEAAPPAGRTTEPPADEDRFQSGQGPKRAFDYLEEQALVKKNDIWIFSKETDFREGLVAGERAYVDFNKLDGRLQDLKKKLPRYDRLEASTQAALQTLTSRREYVRSNTELRKYEAKRGQLNATLKSVAVFRSKLGQYEVKTGDRYEEWEDHLIQAEQAWALVQRKYQNTAKNEAVVAALNEIGGELRPLDKLNKHARKMVKLREAFDKVKR